jgi:hypothetical protein
MINLKQAEEKITWQIYNVSLWIKYVVSKHTICNNSNNMPVTINK